MELGVGGEVDERQQLRESLRPVVRVVLSQQQHKDECVFVVKMTLGEDGCRCFFEH